MNNEDFNKFKKEMILHYTAVIEHNAKEILELCGIIKEFESATSDETLMQIYYREWIAFQDEQERKKYEGANLNDKK